MPLTSEHCVAFYKVLILGDSGVGKSAILRSLTGSEYKENMLPTVGVDFVTKIVEADGALVSLRIWDTGGQERFRSIQRQQYDKTQGVILVYDITDRESYTPLLDWIDVIENEIHHNHSKVEPIPIILCGNKTDLEDQRQVSREEGQKLVDDSKVFEFYETSAKTRENIFTAFQRLAFHVTDICNPELMKSYHRFMMKDPDTVQTEKTKASAGKGKKTRKKAPKPRKAKDGPSKKGKDGAVKQPVSRFATFSLFSCCGVCRGSRSQS